MNKKILECFRKIFKFPTHYLPAKHITILCYQLVCCDAWYDQILRWQAGAVFPCCHPGVTHLTMLPAHIVSVSPNSVIRPYRGDWSHNVSIIVRSSTTQHFLSHDKLPRFCAVSWWAAWAKQFSTFSCQTQSVLIFNVRKNFLSFQVWDETRKTRE